MAEGPEERFLGDLQGIFAVAGHLIGQSEQRLPVGKNERLERRGISGEHPGGQFDLLHVHFTTEYIAGGPERLRADTPSISPPLAGFSFPLNKKRRRGSKEDL